MTREIVWELIRGNPHYKNEDKPKRITDIMKLSFDDKPEKKKATKLTAQDLRVFEELQFGIKKEDGT